MKRLLVASAFKDAAFAERYTPSIDPVNRDTRFPLASMSKWIEGVTRRPLPWLLGLVCVAAFWAEIRRRRAVSVVVCACLAALAACRAPLRQAEVTISSPPVQLGATIYAPDAMAPVPAVLLLHGSGPDGRDNVYYRLLVDAFVRRGIAVLVYDKRGYGASTGDWREAPFSALVDDAEAAFRTLRAHPWIDSTRVGVWGGSEGATIASLVAARASGIKFLIVQSMSGVPFGEQYLYQAAREFRGQADSAAVIALVRAKLAYVRNSTSWPAYDSLVRASAGRAFASYATPAARESWWWGWYATKVDVTALPTLSALRTPTLAIWGADDVLVPADTSRVALTNARAPLRQTGDRVLFIEGAGHTLQVPGFRGFLHGAGLRNRPVHLRAMVQWTVEQVERR